MVCYGIFWSSILPHSPLFFFLGLRRSVLLVAFLPVLGKGLQVIPLSDNKMRTIFINVGQFISMAGGPVSISASPLISATWFPPSERTTATATATLIGFYGTAIAFAVGPAIVTNSAPQYTISNSSSETMQSLAKPMSHQVTQYILLELCLCIAAFLCVLVYFPSNPPLPPSLTSSRPHTQNVRDSFRQVARDGQFWLLASAAALSFGVYLGWLSMLDVVLAKFEVDPTTAGWLGCGATLAGGVSGIMLAR